MTKKAVGIHLDNSYPKIIFDAIGEETIRAYKWRVHYAIPATDFDEFKELEDSEILIDGNKLIKQINKYPDMQWIWGYFQAFEKDIPDQEILMDPPYDLDSYEFCNDHYALTAGGYLSRAGL